MYKRNYHPLVIICFWQGLLDDNALKQIPASTRSYWNKSIQNQLYGYQWIEEFMLKNVHVKEVMQHKWLFRTTRFVCRIYKCFHLLTEQTVHFRKTLKTHMHHIIKTIDAIAVTLPLKTACRIFNFTTHKYYHYKNKIHCTASLLNLCFKTHSQQLSLSEASVIKEEIVKAEHTTHPLSTMYYTLLNSGKSFCSLGTFYKYASLLKSEPYSPVEIKRYHPLKATKPFEYLHIDVTNVNTIEGIMKVAFVKDNFSKAILNFDVSKSANSTFIRNLFKRTFEQYKLNLYKNPVTIISDGGPENKGDLNKWISSLENPQTVKLTAKLDIPSSNSMSESANYIFKQDYLKGQVLDSREQLNELLQFFLSDYNHQRYPVELYGYTPFEVLFGCIPDRTRFKELILQARGTRLDQNHKGRCEKCTF